MTRTPLRPEPDQKAIESLEDEPKSKKQLGVVEAARLQVGKLVDHERYEQIQKIATYTSVFAETGYRFGCGMANVPADEQLAQILRLGPLPVFAANLGLKSCARGVDHLKTPEPYIDGVSLLAEATTSPYLMNTRIARLLRGAKGLKAGRQIAKFMRVTQAAQAPQSLEDQSMREISQIQVWTFMGILSSLPLVADFREIDYSNPIAAGGEMAFNGAMIGAFRLSNSAIRGVLHRNYTQTLDQSRDRVHQMIEDYPELAFLGKEFEYFDQKAADFLSKKLGLREADIRDLVKKMQDAEDSSVKPSLIWKQWCTDHGVKAKYDDYAGMLDRVSKNEILVIVEGLLESLVSMKDLINPVGEDLELNENGDIKTKELDAAVMVTDLRNFTPLTTSEMIRGNVFAFLKLNYFAYLKHVIKRHGGKILNHTGDGLVVYFSQPDKEKRDQAAVECAQEIDQITNLMDDIWHQQGIAHKGDDHRTGIGISTGTIRIGDVLTLTEQPKTNEDEAPQSVTMSSILQVQHAFEREASRFCDWIDVVNEERRQGGISRLVGMGEPINVAARLESIAKAFPEHTGFIRESYYKSLPESARSKYQPLEEVQLKGVRAVEMLYGLPRQQV